MLYQLGIILIFIVAALIISKRYKNNENKDLVYEDELDKDELEKLKSEFAQLYPPGKLRG